MRLFLFLFLSSILLAGCVAPASRWRDDALNRFNSAISAGSQQYAPEETDNIRETLLLADQYFSKNLIEEADRLYLLSSQKCQLLNRSLVLSKIAGDTAITVEADMKPISPDEVLRSEQAADTTEQTEQQHTVVAGKTPFSPDNSSRSTKRRSTSRRKTVPNIEAAPDQPKRAKPVGTTIYLTFDDGPSHLTLPIASFLKSEGVQATFFVLGRNIKGREKAVTATIAMGHRVGNHTLSHNLKKLRSSLESETSEVKRTGDMIERLGGDGKIVRIPYGVSGKALVSQVAAEGVQIFEWDINSNDSTQRGVRDHLYIENTILNQLNKSSRKHLILLFHDGAGHDSTLVAIRDLIPRLKQEGYRFGLLARSEKVARTTEKGKTVQ